MKAGFKSEKTKLQGNANNLKDKKVECKAKQEKSVSTDYEFNSNFVEEFNTKVISTKSSETNFNKVLPNNFIELEEKVNLLLQIFKNYGCKLHTKDQEEFLNFNTAFEDSWHFFNLNKRMSAAEEGIKNLSLIIEELLKESTHRKETIIEESLGLCDERDMEGMTSTQRINILKKKNDLLTCFMKALLKIGSFEEISDKLAYSPKDANLKHFMKEPRKHYEIKEQIEKAMKESEPNFSREIMSDVFEKQSLYNHDSYISKENNFQDNPQTETVAIKPESSSKQEGVSDCKFNRRAEAEKVIEEIKRKTSNRNYKGKFSQVSDNANQYVEDICKEKIKLSSNETLLLSSLEQAQEDVFSKYDWAKKDLNNGKSISQIQKPILKKNDFESNFNSIRYSQTPTFQTGDTENQTFKKSNTLSSIPEECPATVTKYKFEMSSAEQRPNTAPVTTKPPLRSNNKKLVTREDKTKTISEINNNIKTKNKSLLNKKSFV